MAVACNSMAPNQPNSATTEPELAVWLSTNQLTSSLKCAGCLSIFTFLNSGIHHMAMRFWTPTSQMKLGGRIFLTLHILVCKNITWGCGWFKITSVNSMFTKQLRKFSPGWFLRPRLGKAFLPSGFFKFLMQKKSLFKWVYLGVFFTDWMKIQLVYLGNLHI